MKNFVFITSDRNFRENGHLDPEDQKMIRDIKKHGYNLKIMTIAEVAINRQKVQSEGGRALEIPGYQSIGLKDLDKLISAADGKLEECRNIISLHMNCYVAQDIRKWRVTARYTWRSVARAAYRRILTHSQGWEKFSSPWQPPANQIAGMVLCEAAARALGEDYQQPPWN